MTRRRPARKRCSWPRRVVDYPAAARLAAATLWLLFLQTPQFARRHPAAARPLAAFCSLPCLWGAALPRRRHCSRLRPALTLCLSRLADCASHWHCCPVPRHSAARPAASSTWDRYHPPQIAPLHLRSLPTICNCFLQATPETAPLTWDCFHLRLIPFEIAPPSTWNHSIPCVIALYLQSLLVGGFDYQNPWAVPVLFFSDSNFFYTYLLLRYCAVFPTQNSLSRSLSWSHLR